MAEYIGRMKVISAVKGYGKINYPEYMQDWVTKLKRAILQDITDDVMEIPAADVVEVRHGEWLDAPYTYFGAKRYECSQCRDDEFWKKRYIEIKESYCPNCGAKMDGENNAAD